MLAKFNCRLLIFIVAWLSSGAICLASYSPTPPALVHAQDQADQPNDAIERQVEKLVEQLSVPSFSERQSATEKLWEMGPSIIVPLRKALDHPDPEVVKRIESLTVAFEMGIDAETARSQALMVMYFESGTQDMRAQIVRNLELQRDYQTIFELLMRIKDREIRRTLYFDEISLDSVIFRLAKEQEWSLIDEILTHKVAWSFDFQLATYYALITGSLEQKITDLTATIDRDREKFQKKPVAAKDKTARANKKNEGRDENLDKATQELAFARKEYQADLMLLVRLFRVTNQRSKAIEYLQLVDSEVHKQKLGNLLLMEMGDWEAVEANLADIETNTTTKAGQLTATLAQRALIHHFTGNEVAFNEAIKRMESAAIPEESKEKKEGANKTELIAIRLLTLNWDEASKLLDRTNEARLFMTYTLMQREREAFEAVGLTDNVEQRLLWFERLSKRLASIFRQYERAGSNEGVVRRLNDQIKILSVIDEDAVSQKSEQVFQLGLDTANQLGTLGHTKEALLHLRKLADTIRIEDPRSQEMRLKILRAFVSLEQYEDAWQLVEQRFKRVEYATATVALFVRKPSRARYWYNALKSEYPDELERLKAVAAILNSPLQTPQVQVDLKEVTSVVDSSLISTNATTRGQTNSELAMMWYFHGDFERGKVYHERAANDGFKVSSEYLDELSYETGNYQEAANRFDRVWQRGSSATSSTYAAIAATICFERLKQPDLVVQRKIAAYAGWLESYRTDEIVSKLEQQKKSDRLGEFLNVTVHATTSTSLTNEIYRLPLAQAETEYDPVRAYRNLQVNLFNQLASNNGYSAESMIVRCSQFKLAQAEWALHKGDIEQVEKIVTDYNHFRPGDTDIFEKLIPALTEQGHSEVADRLFALLTQYYSELLSLYPDSPLNQNNYSWACAIAKRRVDYVHEHSELAVRLRPDNPSYLDTLAEIEFLRGNKEEARDLSKRCIQISPMKLHYLQQFLRFGGQL